MHVGDIAKVLAHHCEWIKHSIEVIIDIQHKGVTWIARLEPTCENLTFKFLSIFTFLIVVVLILPLLITKFPLILKRDES